MSIKVDMATNDRIVEAVESIRSGNPVPEVQWMYDQWVNRYTKFSRQRFAAYSLGAGDWPALALSTIRARRKGKAQTKFASSVKSKGKNLDGVSSSLARDTRRGGALVSAGGRRVSILQDTRTLIKALELGKQGNFVQVHPGGVTYGIAGGSHESGGAMTIGRLAEIHHEGNSRLPARKILVDPDSATIRGIENDSARMIDRLRRTPQ